MSEFNNTLWADTKFSNNYIDKSNSFLPYRKEIIEIFLSYCDYFISKNGNIKIMELGCGDGYTANKILSNNKIEKAVLIDGSNQMLMAAKERLNKFNNIEYRHISFQDLINKQEITGKYNLIFSSLAIHHLTLEEKGKLYRLIYDLLLTDGSFINYDVVLPLSLNLEPWYLDIWKNWIENNEQANPSLNNIPQQYKDNKDNIPSSLEEQLKILNDIGFNNVDCYFKYGVFAVFGGKKI